MFHWRFFSLASLFSLFSLGMKVAWLVSIIGAATYVAYIIALILPLIYPYCPFKVPLTLYIPLSVSICQRLSYLTYYLLHTTLSVYPCVSP